jgi:hypothetical protein
MTPIFSFEIFFEQRKKDWIGDEHASSSPENKKNSSQNILRIFWGFEEELASSSFQKFLSSFLWEKKKPFEQKDWIGD